VTCFDTSPLPGMLSVHRRELLALVVSQETKKYLLLAWAHLFTTTDLDIVPKKNSFLCVDLEHLRAAVPGQPTVRVTAPCVLVMGQRNHTGKRVLRLWAPIEPDCPAVRG